MEGVVEAIVSAVRRRAGLVGDVEARLSVFAVLDVLRDLLTDEEADALAACLPLEAAVVLRRSVDDEEPRISSTFAWRETVRDILDSDCIATVCHVIGRECPLELRAKLELKLPSRVERRLALRRASDPTHRAPRVVEASHPTWRPGVLRAVS
jgi:uncharacterized protein (DUF2267 family)